jgi:8-oxo-dGTP diphosphatase
MPDPLGSIHVVAAVITDPRGRILLARRGDGRDLAGLWEFPGGKREPGETSEAALIRELQEELSITVQVGARLIEVPQQYPDKRLRLDVRHVSAWSGTPRGLEGQALAWVVPEKLSRYPMPPADRPVVAAMLQPDRYLITPEPHGDGSQWLTQLSAALSAGVRRVQLRSREMRQAEWHALAAEAVRRCRKAGAEVLVNGDVQLARALGTGLHLRASQLAEHASPALGGGPLAASCHDADELHAAQALGCDFVVLGPVQRTATHPEATPIGWDRFARLRESVSLPIYALGGLAPTDIPESRRHGAQGIAAISGLWPAA